MTATYADLVAEAEQTCYSCPTQWEGRLKDGRFFYFRFRHGYVSVSLGDEPCPIQSEVHAGERITHDDLGVMSDREYESWLVKMVARIDAQAAAESNATMTGLIEDVLRDHALIGERYLREKSANADVCACGTLHPQSDTGRWPTHRRHLAEQIARAALTGKISA